MINLLDWRTGRDLSSSLYAPVMNECKNFVYCLIELEDGLWKTYVAQAVFMETVHSIPDKWV